MVSLSLGTPELAAREDTGIRLERHLIFAAAEKADAS
jgi:hypothetical protein